MTKFHMTKKMAWIIALVYLISPVDLLPDIAPPFTYADDLLGLILAAIYKEKPPPEAPVEMKVA